MKKNEITNDKELSSPGQNLNVRSIERCIDVLDFLANNNRPSNLTELAATIDAPKSTALMILRTLVGRGLLAYDPRGKTYRIGLGFARYAELAHTEIEFRELALPHLESLVDITKETATLAMTDGVSVFHICRVLSPQALQYAIPLGVPRPMHSTAGGKVFLAHMPREERLKFYEKNGLPMRTERTIIEVEVLEDQLEVCRTQGYAIARGETAPELFGIAAPVFNAGGKVMAAVNLGGPLFRFDSGRDKCIESVISAAEVISRELHMLEGASIKY